MTHDLRRTARRRRCASLSAAARRLLLVVLGIVLALTVVEIGARQAGYEPWPGRVRTTRAVLHEPDPVLGWRNKAGSFVWPERVPGTGDIRMTFWEGGLRATAPRRVARDRRLLVLGCSYSQGWAVSDEQTYPWRLQSAFPWLEVLNYGTAAYGTYQSLLALERYFASGEPVPELLIYGFVPFHAPRNVAAPSWLRGLALVGDASTLRIPHATAGLPHRAARQPPISYPTSIVSEWSAAVALALDAGVEIGGRARALQAEQVTRALLREMKSSTDRRGVPLLVVLLARGTPPETKAWTRFFSRSEIAMVDCSHPDQEASVMRVPGYGHPNADMNLHWFQCIRRALRLRGLAAR